MLSHMSQPPFRPYVAAENKMPEFTLRAVLLGVIISVILGAANAYLGLKAGMTVAATYPAAVIAGEFFLYSFLQNLKSDKNFPV